MARRQFHELRYSPYWPLSHARRLAGGAMRSLSLVPFFVGGLTLWVLLISRLHAWICERDHEALWQLVALLIGCGVAFAVHH